MDNSGARFVECIKTLGGFNRKISYPGDFILVSIKSLRLIRKVRVGQIHLALITRARKEARYLDESSSKSENNVVIIVNKKKRVIGTRVFG
jgi:large subunit ribosomal protein L14